MSAMLLRDSQKISIVYYFNKNSIDIFFKPALKPPPPPPPYIGQSNVSASTPPPTLPPPCIGPPSVSGDKPLYILKFSCLVSL